LIYQIVFFYSRRLSVKQAVGQPPESNSEEVPLHVRQGREFGPNFLEA